MTYPEGQVTVDALRRQITGYNSERQDWIIDPISIHEAASGFKGYFCARFDRDFASYGLVQNGTTLPEDTVQVQGPLVSAYARFAPGHGDDGSLVVNVRVGVSFISTEQACKNVDNEIPDGTTLEDTARKTRSAWAEKLGRIDVEGAKSDDDLAVFYTAAFHALQVRRTSLVVHAHSGLGDSVPLRARRGRQVLFRLRQQRARRRFVRWVLHLGRSCMYATIGR